MGKQESVTRKYLLEVGILETNWRHELNFPIFNSKNFRVFEEKRRFRCYNEKE